jgi:hypothetical protein
MTKIKLWLIDNVTNVKLESITENIIIPSFGYWDQMTQSDQVTNNY